MQSGGGVSASGAQAAVALGTDNALARFPTFQHVVDLVRTNRDVKLLVEIEGGVRLVNYQPGRIEFEPSPNAASDLSQRLGSRLQAWTGVRWTVTIVTTGGTPTIVETRDAKRKALADEARVNPLVNAVFAAFPKAKLGVIRTPEEISSEVAHEALAEVEDEWDPFEDE